MTWGACCSLRGDLSQECGESVARMRNCNNAILDGTTASAVPKSRNILYYREGWRLPDGPAAFLSEQEDRQQVRPAEALDYLPVLSEDLGVWLV